MILRRAAMLVLLITSVLARIGFAAESSLLQATAVYGVIATDPMSRGGSAFRLRTKRPSKPCWRHRQTQKQKKPNGISSSTIGLSKN